MKNLTLTVTGAYGRRPTLTDWIAGMDFHIVNGPYCSIRDVPRIRSDGYLFIDIVDYPTGNLIRRIDLRTEA